MHTKLSHALLVLAAVAPTAAAQSNVSASLKGATLTIKGSAGVDELSIDNAELLADGDGPT